MKSPAAGSSSSPTQTEPQLLSLLEHPGLLAALDGAQQAGFLGPGPVEPHIAHALGFAATIVEPDRALDLGSGNGLPGLVLALLWPRSHWVLLDSTLRRTRLLETAVEQLDLTGRVEVVFARAEDYGRTEARGTFDLVVARSFGPPAVTAECAAPLLRVGGHLVVSEPPDETVRRWGGAPVEQLGLEDQGVAGTPAMQRLLQASLCPDRYPRRPGIPSKRPLWDVPRETRGP